MATCEDCLHIEVCAYIKHDLPICSDFADRSKYVVREKGEWVMKENMIRSPYAKNAYCPFCLEETSYAHNFCPNCGADMRKGENG